MIATVPASGLGLTSKLFRALGDASRLSILGALRAGPRTVGEIVTATGLSQSNTSNHLGCLTDCGLIAREQRGKFAVYQLADQRVAGLLALAEELLADVASGVYACTRITDQETRDDDGRT